MHTIHRPPDFFKIFALKTAIILPFFCSPHTPGFVTLRRGKRVARLMAAERTDTDFYGLLRIIRCCQTAAAAGVKRQVPPFAAYAGSTVDGGFGGKYWEGLGGFGCFAAHYSNIVHGGKRRKTAATSWVWQAEHYPAYSSPEQSVYRLQRALPASQYFPNPPKSSQFYRAAHPASLHYAATSRCSPYDSISQPLPILSQTLPNLPILSHTFPYFPIFAIYSLAWYISL